MTCYAETETNSTIEGGYIYTRLGEARITEYYPLEGLNVISKAEVYIYKTTKSCSKPMRYMHEYGATYGHLQQCAGLADEEPIAEDGTSDGDDEVKKALEACPEDLEFPEGVEVLTDPEVGVVHVAAPRLEVTPAEEEAAEAVEGEEAPEGEAEAEGEKPEAEASETRE